MQWLVFMYLLQVKVYVLGPEFINSTFGALTTFNLIFVYDLYILYVHVVTIEINRKVINF